MHASTAATCRNAPLTSRNALSDARCSGTSAAFCGLQADHSDVLLDNADGRRDRFYQSRSTQRSTAHRTASARPGSTPSATSTVYLSLIVIHFWLISTIGLSDERIV